ncbi:LytR/AlgR family response regulator transcription factor [[Clostridium] fimetarium]|uniref:Stage 0 sporulation protein A homolog n=1 Tax=[Clostridium] fimetarium TaxID=99656 RepID=A0A1I0NK10_9FIRM|nr:LytTR family DNA-binding domain-containing protein [[Clostridium] fimetarium]SEW01836.1 DNA-binding response regulator, LytR/AlgR family [[Clostridium] fimetarium]
MLRFAICDDEKTFREVETETISRIMKQKYEHVSYGIIQYHCGNDLIKDYVNNKFDVIFLDIELGEENGFDVASSLTKIRNDTNIVFVTTYENLVFDSFVFRPLGFVRKRAFENEFEQVMFRMVQYFVDSNQMIIFGMGKEKYEFLLDEIRTVCSYKHDIIVSSENDDVTIRDQLLKYENELLKKSFVIASRGYMINLKYVREIDGKTLYLFNDKFVEISRSRLKEVKDGFRDYQLKYAKGRIKINGLNDTLPVSDTE